MNDRSITIVTGSATGIGRGIAERLVADGRHVALISRNIDRLSAAAAALGPRASAHRADLSDRTAVEAVVAQIADMGTIAGLVNNAGAGFFNNIDTPLAESEKIWDDCHAANLKSVFLLSAATIPHLRPGSAIVNVSSITARTGSVNYLAYAAAKSGIEGLSFVLARSLAPRDVTVNVIEPGFYAETGQIAGWDPKPIVANVPLGRAGKPEDIAGTVAWLLSADARYITGAIIPVSGGWRFGG